MAGSLVNQEGGGGESGERKQPCLSKSLSDNRCAPTSLHPPRTQEQRGKLTFNLCVRVWSLVKPIIIKEDNVCQGMQRAITI